MEENKYRYNDISERLRRMNRIYMGATIFMAALILLYLWMKQMNHNIKTVTVYGNTVLLFLAVFSASEIGNKGCMFIFHQPEIPEELKNM